MIRLAPGLALVALCACFGGGGSWPQEEDPEAAAFFRRARAFYAALDQVPIDALLTYENPELHGYFTGPAAFADYYSGIANQVRDASLRDGSAHLEILEFRLQLPDTAQVLLLIAGRHERALRFWRIELPRIDAWRRVDGIWLLAPEKL